MFLKTKLVKISKFLYFVLLFILPINLGKHFEIFDSYVGGVLVDYLVPTVFVQDILVVLIIFFWILSGGLKKVLCERDLLKKRYVQYSTLFVFSLFLSTLNSARFVPSIYAWLRLFLYFLLLFIL